jgi:predicted porin
MVIIGNGADSNVGNATGAVSFFRRHRRSINWHSPNWGGFNLQAAFSAGNEATNIPDSAGLAPRMYSLAGQFRTGPFFAGLAYEAHDDFNPAAGFGGTTAGYTGGTDSSINAVVGFTFAGARLSALYMKNEYEFDGSQIGGPAGKQTAEHDGFALYLDWTLQGPHSIYAQYGDRGDIDVAGVTQNSSGAQVMGFAYGYRLSKRSQLYASYNQMKNDSNANFSFGTGSVTSGGKQTVIGVGLRHSF